MKKTPAKKSKVPPASTMGGVFIGIRVDDAMHGEISKRAKALHISKAKYCKLVMKEWLAKGTGLIIRES